MNTSVRTVTNAERRARLGVRHSLVERVADPLAAASAVVCLHATEPSSVFLSAFARCGASRADVDRTLYDGRSLIKQLAMRRTVFAVPRDLLPAIRGSAAARVAAPQARLLARSVVAGGLADDGDGWVEQTCADVLALLREAPATTAQLRSQLPALTERLPPPERGAGATPTPVASRVLAVLAGGEVVRGYNEGGWTVSRPLWVPLETWLDDPGVPLDEGAGYAELVRRWLWSFGPGTEADLVWWLGATKTAVRRALADVGAVAARLEDGSPAWLHPDDVGEVRAPRQWAALLPALDPTTMGWRGRRFYVDGPTAEMVYDSAGNGRSTAWWDGRIVVLQTSGRLSRAARTALRRQARQLTVWLEGHVLRSSLRSPVPGR